MLAQAVGTSLWRNISTRMTRTTISTQAPCKAVQRHTCMAHSLTAA
jgi:hypothetical protein